MAEGSLLRTAISPSRDEGAENSCGASLINVVRAEFSSLSGLSRESFNCLRPPARSLVALESFPDDSASLTAGRSSPERTEEREREGKGEKKEQRERERNREREKERKRERKGGGGEGERKRKWDIKVTCATIIVCTCAGKSLKIVREVQRIVVLL